ncbi:uncharacterized protein PV09_00293 [Verruconis gallopava]|uniref:Initiator tRNA phosphoribosyl transferase n=1 Tax=Verruconis gallopava TaxID=253628 RepID=A0A0D2BD82_9PEZI|nr:uncharacterized protein PV09_00293 [Verruconis gallopava]KIW09399.1 hypothetical protein PV09_00293 [Verruconis gallopava]
MPKPISTSDLIFSSQATDFARTLSSLKRSTLNVPNRLRSIAEDADFVAEVASAFDLPLVANERCGSWYIRPEKKAESCYFKSTDGHDGQWSFSLRRLNVQVFDVVARSGGCVVVDSTRRGKAMPDALAKTVPIWCAVFNRALFPHDVEAGRLYTPPRCVSPNEHAQIERRIDGFVGELQGLALDFAELRAKVKRPLRPLWVTRESDLPASAPRFEAFCPVVLCTASRRVVGGEISEGGYIQGAGDDAEGWSHGLTPALFWAHKQELLSAREEDLSDLIASYLSTSVNNEGDSKVATVKRASWLGIGSFSCLTASSFTDDCAVVTVGIRNALPTSRLSPKLHLHLECRERKLGSRDLRTQLPQLRPFVEGLQSVEHVVVCDATGRDLAVGVALALLCLYADDSGLFSKMRSPQIIDKGFIKQRLSWIMTSYPGASPSRTTLQSINDYLLSEQARKTPVCFKASTSADEERDSPAKRIFKDLEGQWTLDRDIISFRDDSLGGKVTGTAIFLARTATAEDAELEYLYREEGNFTAITGVEMTINRRWIWRLSRRASEEEIPCVSIHFVKADGETEDYLYNRLALTAEQIGCATTKVLSADAHHACGRDLYVSSYEFRLRNGRLESWNAKHEVKGPAKDYVSTTRLCKVDPSKQSS